MSGGSHNYIYNRLANALNMPTGHYGDIKHDNNSMDYRWVTKSNPMHDIELSLLMYDISCLLHSLEWCDSSDIGEDTYMKDVKAFKDKWIGRSKEARTEECLALVRIMAEELIENYFGKQFEKE